MATAHATTLSTKGQLILPRAIRERRKWGAGTRLSIEDTPDGVLIKPLPLFKPTTMDEIVGCLKYDGPAKTIEEMNEGVLEEARRQFLGEGKYAGD